MVWKSIQKSLKEPVNKVQHSKILKGGQSAWTIHTAPQQLQKLISAQNQHKVPI